MMRFYYAPGACSLGIHVILEEIGAPYEAVAIDLKSGEQRGKTFRSVNPKGKLPALVREDGSLLTEFQAIAFWLAKSHPEAGLIPSGLEGEVRVLEALDFIVGSVHMRGFTLMLVPAKFVVTSGAQDEVRAHGREMAAKGLKQLSRNAWRRRVAARGVQHRGPGGVLSDAMGKRIRAFHAWESEGVSSADVVA
jgi:glutathione S-transferase